MDNQPEVPETFPPKHEMTAKCARLASGPAVVVPCPTPVPVVPSPKRPPFTSVSRKVHEVSDTPLQMVLLTGEISIISLQCIMALNTSAAAVSLPKWLPFMAMAKGTQEVPAISPSSIVSLREFPLSSLSRNTTQGISAPPSPTKDGPPQSLPHLTMPTVIQEGCPEASSRIEPQELPIKSAGAPPSLIPSSLAQELSVAKCEHTSHS